MCYAKVALWKAALALLVSAKGCQTLESCRDRASLPLISSILSFFPFCGPSANFAFMFLGPSPALCTL